VSLAASGGHLMAWCTSTLVEGGLEIASPTEKKSGGPGRNELKSLYWERSKRAMTTNNVAPSAARRRGTEALVSRHVSRVCK